MTAAELIAALQALPPDMPVLVSTEGGVDHALAVRIITADQCRREQPPIVGQFREVTEWIDAGELVGQPFKAALIG